MGDAEPSEVLEGFICPICKADFGNPRTLLSHFQEEHSDEQDLIKTLRDIFDKAKKKILKHEVTTEFTSPRSTSTNSFVYIQESQQMGLTRCHKEYFMQIREERQQRIAVPTNQIIIRLEKLLDKMPTDPSKRKQHEKDVVPWINGNDVKRCPNCADLFHVARRQHHCRTCGSVMCSDCSRFISVLTAIKLLEKTLPDAPLESNGGEHSHIRLCVHCLNLLDIREERKTSKNVNPIISQFYKRLSEYKIEADNFMADYRKMCASLNLGESTFSLEAAQELKFSLLKLAENIEALSSKIAILGKDAEHPPQGLELRLQTMIRDATTMYLRNHLLNLPELPTEDEFQKIQEKRRQEITAKIQEEKTKQQIRTPVNHSTKYNGPSPQKALSKGQGWVPETKKRNESDDPLIEQMNIIRSYIKEAKLAHKNDEVASLEENLRELKKEYLKKQQQDEFNSSVDSCDTTSETSTEEGVK
ncbi:rabenosyn-5 isoform X2 [Cimex lectularius]|uniref:Rabenosyn-5 n=1 Tax=Cimex lectularius TaxID=79782 RepID=A0A8I6RJT6_CIMLE|nr:rabenosyn-5 isoform X2 [Cimex lectularius]